MSAPPAIIAPRALPLLPPLLRAWSFSFCLEGCLPTSRCAALPARPRALPSERGASRSFALAQARIERMQTRPIEHAQANEAVADLRAGKIIGRCVLTHAPREPSM